MATLDLFTLARKTALVTGASYGLGARFATTLAEAGANVVVAARSVDKLEQTAKAVEEHGVKALVQACDVTDGEQVQATVAAAWETFGRVDVLVNNAGVIADMAIMAEKIPDALFAQTIATNLTGVFSFCREVGARQLADGKGGSIINVASVAGMGGEYNFSPSYQASKAAVINLSRNLGVSWASRGVRVNSLCPGWFTSEMTAPFLAIPEMVERIKAQTPMGRHGADDELDGMLIYLASDASRYVTGAVMAVDGGITACLGGQDWTPGLYNVVEGIAGDFGVPIRPA